MVLTTTAVYEGGVLKVPHHLRLPEGEPVRVIILSSTPADVNGPEQVARRHKSIERLNEIYAEADAEPDDGYDLLEALNENRIRAGWRPILPADEGAK